MMDFIRNDIYDESKVKILCVGCPLLDIASECQDGILEQYGLNTDDCVKAKESHDSLFQKLFLSVDSKMVAGGSAQNTARVAKWALGVDGESAFVGCVGCDDYASWMSEKLESEGVTPLYIKLRESSTGVCACLVSGEGDRSMCARQGAGALLKTRHLKLESVRRELEGAHCLFVEGYVLGHSPDVVTHMAENHGVNQIFSMSLSAEYVCRVHKDELLKIIPKINVLFGNQAEVLTLAREISGKKNLTVEESVHLVHQLQASEPRVFVVSQGPNPLIVADSTDNLRTYSIPSVATMVDSVGCGDALAGAFLAKYVLARDLDNAACSGVEAAGKILQVNGCDIASAKKDLNNPHPDTNIIS